MYERRSEPVLEFDASLYALYSGIVFLVAVGLLGAPILHRVLHRLHADG